MSCVAKALFLCLVSVGLAGNLSADVIIYSEVGFSDSVLSFDTTTEISTNVQSHPGADPRSVAIDHVAKKIYYSQGTSINVSNFDGSGGSEIINLGAGVGVTALEIDSLTGTLYFAVSSGTAAVRSIRSVKTDGTSMTTIHDNASLSGVSDVTANSVSNIKLDVFSGILYWTADNGANGGRTALNSSTLAGGSVVNHWVADNRNAAISKMDIDFDSSKLYYTVGGDTAEVRRSNIDNSALETLTSGLGRPNAIAIDDINDELYFVVGGTIYTSELDGSSLTSATLGTSSLFSVSDMEFASTTAIPEPGSITILGLLALCFCRRRKRRVS